MQFQIENLPENITPSKIQHWMTIKNIKSAELKQADFEAELLNSLINQLVATCLADDGIGLAAPQIGIFKRVIVCRDFVEMGGKHHLLPTFQVYINPDFEPVIDKKKTAIKEYCLSVPDAGFDITRWNSINITWQEQDPENSGNVIEKTKLLENFAARIFQHEFDHLNGISIPQRWELQNKKLMKKTRKK